MFEKQQYACSTIIFIVFVRDCWHNFWGIQSHPRKILKGVSQQIRVEIINYHPALVTSKTDPQSISEITHKNKTYMFTWLVKNILATIKM